MKNVNKENTTIENRSEVYYTVRRLFYVFFYFITIFAMVYRIMSGRIFHLSGVELYPEVIATLGAAVAVIANLLHKRVMEMVCIIYIIGGIVFYLIIYVFHLTTIGQYDLGLITYYHVAIVMFLTLRWLHLWRNYR